MTLIRPLSPQTDRETREFSPHPALADTAKLKSFSVNRTTGRIAYVQAEGSNWWAERVHLLEPAGLLHLPKSGDLSSDVFFSDEDRRMYLDLLRKYSE